jgi:chromosome segregation ATPase
MRRRPFAGLPAAIRLPVELRAKITAWAELQESKSRVTIAIRQLIRLSLDTERKSGNFATRGKGQMMATTDSRFEDLERRLRTAESGIVGDRHVSQYAAEQARRGTEAFLALRSEVAALRADMANTTARVDALAESMAIVNATLVRHGRALDVLQQDVRQMRQESAERHAELLQDMRQMRQESAERHAELLAAVQVLASGGPAPV